MVLLSWFILSHRVFMHAIWLLCWLTEITVTELQSGKSSSIQGFTKFTQPNFGGIYHNFVNFDQSGHDLIVHPFEKAGAASGAAGHVGVAQEICATILSSRTCLWPGSWYVAICWEILEASPVHWARERFLWHIPGDLEICYLLCHRWDPMQVSVIWMLDGRHMEHLLMQD